MSNYFNINSDEIMYKMCEIKLSDYVALSDHFELYSPQLWTFSMHVMGWTSIVTFFIFCIMGETTIGTTYHPNTHLSISDLATDNAYNQSVIISGLEITAGSWSFSDQFQHLANQNPFWSTKFPVHFQWDSNQ